MGGGGRCWEERGGVGTPILRPCSKLNEWEGGGGGGSISSFLPMWGCKEALMISIFLRISNLREKSKSSYNACVYDCGLVVGD